MRIPIQGLNFFNESLIRIFIDHSLFRLPYDLRSTNIIETVLCCIFNKSWFYCRILNGYCSAASDIYAWIFLFFKLAGHFLRYFGTFSRLHSIIWGLLQAFIGLPILPGSIKIAFSIHCIATCLQKSKVGIISPQFWKFPDASAVLTSVTARYHAKLRSGKNLVSHVLYSEIWEWRLLLWLSTWWR